MKKYRKRMKDKHDVRARAHEESLSRLFIPVYQCPNTRKNAASYFPHLFAYVVTGEDFERRAVPFLDTSCRKPILSGEKGYVFHHSGRGAFLSYKKAEKKASQWFSQWNVSALARCQLPRKSLNEKVSHRSESFLRCRWRIANFHFYHLLL